jgi:hypothetical protein
MRAFMSAGRLASRPEWFRGTYQTVEQHAVNEANRILAETETHEHTFGCFEGICPGPWEVKVWDNARRSALCEALSIFVNS